MINNNFSLIGYATSDFTNIGYKDLDIYSFSIEIEKLGSKVGNNFELEIQVYSTNNRINTSMKILGHQVCVNGYVDSYRKDGNLYPKLVAQNVIILDRNPSKFAKSAVTYASTPSSSEAYDIAESVSDPL